MTTFFSILKQANMIFLQMMVGLSNQYGLQPVVTGMVVPFGKQGINKMILHPAK